MLLTAVALPGVAQQADAVQNKATRIEHVLLISIDGMHSLDFANCMKRYSKLERRNTLLPDDGGIEWYGSGNYVAATTSMPSDSFPGSGHWQAAARRDQPACFTTLIAIARYRRQPRQRRTTFQAERNLCPSVVGTQIGFDEEIDENLTKLNGGGGIDPNYLPRDPNNGCQVVYPHNYIRVNTVFEVVKANGGYTAWSDKHPAMIFTTAQAAKA